MNPMVPLTDKRVLVTGAAGFLGANLVRALLCAGAEVHVLVRPTTDLWRIAEIRTRLRLHCADLRDKKAVAGAAAAARPAILFHLASASGHPSDPQERRESLETNLGGTLNLLEAAAPLELERLVHIGSLLEYGAKNRPLQESDTLAPSTFRGWAKAATTLLCQQCARANRLPLVVLRLSSVYGPWEAPTRLIPRAISAALNNEELPLTPPGYRHDFVFVDDAVEACLLASQKEEAVGEIINVASGEQWANEEVVKTIGSLCQTSVAVRPGAFPVRSCDAHHWVADIGKARHLLGWSPRHRLRSGLEKTIAWFCRHAEEHKQLYGLSRA